MKNNIIIINIHTSNKDEGDYSKPTSYWIRRIFYYYFIYIYITNLLCCSAFIKKNGHAWL